MRADARAHAVATKPRPALGWVTNPLNSDRFAVILAKFCATILPGQVACRVHRPASSTPSPAPRRESTTARISQRTRRSQPQRQNCPQLEHGNEVRVRATCHCLLDHWTCCRLGPVVTLFGYDKNPTLWRSPGIRHVDESSRPIVDQYDHWADGEQLAVVRGVRKRPVRGGHALQR